MKNTLKLLTVLLLAILALITVGCKKQTPKINEKQLVIFAAASMTETLEEIAKLYKEVAPDITLVFNFDSSGTLKKQIEAGGYCDIFISAAQTQMDQLDISTSDSKLDFIEQGTRINLLENKVVLVVPKNSKKQLTSFKDLAEQLYTGDILLAIGNSDVPVGQYTLKIFDYYNVDQQKLNSINALTYGSNVKEITTQVKEGSVDCGIIYCTDAFSSDLNIIDYATAEMCGQVIYPGAVLNISQSKQDAKSFLNFLTTNEATKFFEAVGFSKVAN